MKIGIVSDTHCHDLPPQLINEFAKVDLIIHAGDFCSVDDYNEFKDLAKIKAVAGNCDEAKLVKKLPQSDVFTVDGVSFGLFHGEGAGAGILQSVQMRFAKEKIDCAIFGHSHTPFNEKIDGVVYFNPGSPNDYVRAPYCSYGIIETNNGKFKAKIVKVR